MVHLYKEYYSAIKNNDIMKFASKGMELEKYHPESGNSDPEKQIWHFLVYKWMLAVK